MPPLAFASLVGNVEAARQLLAVGAKIDAIDAVSRTALHYSCIGNKIKKCVSHERYAELVDLLIAKRC